ncbi:MAG: hypothetical protein HOM21_16650 [Halobacteriovoraceae bacterium]|jgi:hypothetical protein|nr:hypothetical protein [Halobacteriovoraceae bacterium]
MNMRRFRGALLAFLLSFSLNAAIEPLPQGSPGDYSDFGNLNQLEQLKLWRVVQYKNLGDTEWKIYSNHISQLGKHIYGIWSSWGNHPHSAAGHWKTKFRMKAELMLFNWQFQTQPFPLGGQDWTTTQRKNDFKVTLGQFYRSYQTIVDQHFRFTMILLPKTAKLPKDDFPQ